MRQRKVYVPINSFMFFLMAALLMSLSAGGARAQAEQGVWKCYHKVMFPSVCGESGQGTAVDDYYAVKWPLSKKLDAPSCFFKSDSSEWCEGYYTVQFFNPSQQIKWFARGAADLYCPPGTVARQGDCVAVPGQGGNCPITPDSSVDPLSGRSHRQESDWSAGGTAASSGISKSRTDAQSPNDFRVELTRYYSSKYESLNFPFSSRLGVGWRTAFDASASVNTNSLTSATLIHVLLPGSNEYSFAKQSGVWKPVLPRLLNSGSVKWDRAGSGAGFQLSIANNQIFLRHPAGSEYVFDRTGRLIQLRNGAGYMQTLEYSGNLNTRVFDNLGGWIKFIYAHPAQKYLVTTAETSDGTLIFYNYENRYLDINGSKARATHNGYWTLKSVAYGGASPTAVSGFGNRYYEYLADRVQPFLLTGVFDEAGRKLSGWTYDSKGRATSSEEAGGANHWTFTYDDVAEAVKVTDSGGRTATYERKRGSNGVRKLVPIDLDGIFVSPVRSHRPSASPDPGGGECWFGVFCGTPPMCTGPSEDHALEECKRAADGNDDDWIAFCKASKWFVTFDERRLPRCYGKMYQSIVNKKNWCEYEFGD